MKQITIILSILIIIISCKSNITKIKISLIENDKTYNSYMQKLGERPSRKTPLDSIFIYMPITFKLENNTNKDIRISQIWDNFQVGVYHPVIIDNKKYNYIDDKVIIKSSNSSNITLFVHLPVSTNLLDKEHYNRLFPEFENHKRDSIVMNEINPQLHKEIDILLKKKQIFISYKDNKNIKERALAYYCVNKQEISVFKSDSLANLKVSYRHSCD